MLIALDMLDDPEYTRPYLEALMAQILGPGRRIADAVTRRR